MAPVKRPDSPVRGQLAGTKGKTDIGGYGCQYATRHKTPPLSVHLHGMQISADLLRESALAACPLPLIPLTKLT
jgi:hypothetical protein